MSLGGVIRAAREAHGLSKRRLARQLGVTRQAVLYWERDEAIPRPQNLAGLERELKLDLTRHLHESGRVQVADTAAIAEPTAEKGAVYEISQKLIVADGTVIQ